MENYEERSLQQQKKIEREFLARLDVDIAECETKMLLREKPSLEYFEYLEKKNALKKKRQMVASKLTDLRIEIEKLSHPILEI